MHKQISSNVMMWSHENQHVPQFIGAGRGEEEAGKDDGGDVEVHMGGWDVGLCFYLGLQVGPVPLQQQQHHDDGHGEGCERLIHGFMLVMGGKVIVHEYSKAHQQRDDNLTGADVHGLILHSGEQQSEEDDREEAAAMDEVIGGEGRDDDHPVGEEDDDHFHHSQS